ncbi:MAG: hypothetical protein E7202_13070 [Selenomonas ruminantium]|jgi:hypothetical protein|nr:hypothetical protein [Selenomonas ruminantium]
MFKVDKKVIGELEKCYSLAMLHYQGKDHFLCAAEKVNNCYLISLEGEIEETVWEGPGGVMTMVQVPGTDGQFLATRKFYSPNDSKEASIVVVTPKGKDDWEVRTLCDLPFVHRFDILQAGGKNYILACALKSDHEYKEDWRFPGKLFVAELPDDLSTYNDDNQLKLTPIKDNMLKNHGYYRHVEKDGSTSGIVSFDGGVLQVFPPQTAGGEWRIEELITDAASDAVLMDLNGDGEEELCAIAPFHGDTVNIYEKKNDRFELAYTYPEKLEFLHAIFGGDICGKPVWIIGNRKGDRLLLAFTYGKDGYEAQELDRGRGAANVLHYVYEGKDIIIGANRETNEIARYELTE